jgi:predicted RecB family nuclease
MRKLGDRYMYSATDLVNYVACPHVSELDRRSFHEQLKKAAKDEQSELITAKGDEHEKRLLSTLKASGKTLMEIPKMPGASPQEEAAQTREILRDGYDYVYQAAFCDETFTGYADFLVKVHKKSKLGDFSYEVIDSKLGKKEKASHLIQLCFYSDLLEKIQGNLPEHAYIYPGTMDLMTYRVASYYSYYTARKNDFLKHQQERPQSATIPEPCAHCSTCHWRNHCAGHWEQTDHLSLVANITRGQRKQLVASDITTVEQLATTAKATVLGISERILERLRDQARLQFSSRQNGGKPEYTLIAPPVGTFGFSLLPNPELGDLFYDIEGDPLLKEESLKKGEIQLRDGLEYLHGFSWRSASGELHFKPFWARSKEAEKECYEELIEFLHKHTLLHPNARIYHYSPYERAALKRLSSQYPTHTKKLDDLLRGKKFVDLYAIVKQTIRVSEPRYSIKNLERFYRGKRKTDVKDGGASVVWFEKYLATGEEKYLEDIERYNRDDCESTVELRDWLLKLKAEFTETHNVDWDAYVRIPPVEKKTSKKGETEETKAELDDARIKEYHLRFLIDRIQGKPKEKRSESENLRETIFYLADFYRRENKPGWWKHFDRIDRKYDLTLDPECIGDCVLDTSKAPVRIKKSNLHHYRFPVQETKITEGTSLFDAISERNYGEIHFIDTTTGLAVIKLGPSAELSSEVALAPRVNDYNTALNEGLDRFLDAMSDPNLRDISPRDRNYSYIALVDILRKQPPMFKDGKNREQIVPFSANHPEFGAALLDAALNLDRSYLFIQGPPGTGKTHHGARLAVSLLKLGKRIGVTSNSHKAINNFIQEVDAVAFERGVELRGAKKASQNEEDEHYKPKCSKPGFSPQITTYFQHPDIDPKLMNLIAGTAWTFVKEEHHQQFDYLFVDEASQLSLASLVAAGTAARNLILIGDPQQLPQPLQGVHPGELSLSPLEYLLEERGTVPPDKGIFLNVCYRMHTDICKVLSKHVYEDRLDAPPENANQKILIPNQRLITKSSGILFNPCQHDGNTASSPEEVARVVELYQELLGASFVDSKGDNHTITVKDIMVVAPFNIQVNNLKSALPTDAEVGTIDLFQGREAPVVIISMTTSNVEETPRGIDFLFSQQRVNVALSRAKALAIIVGSPRLLSTKCNNPKQMELVNFFCALSMKELAPV